MPEARNCKEYCYYAKQCYEKGDVGLNPFDCPMAWKIEDILNDYIPEDYELEDNEE